MSEARFYFIHNKDNSNDYIIKRTKDRDICLWNRIKDTFWDNREITIADYMMNEQAEVREISEKEVWLWEI